MFNSNPKVQLENSIAQKIFSETLTNDSVKEILQEQANHLRIAVLYPLIAFIEGSKIKNFNEIKSENSRNAITLLAMHHSDELKQYGGLLRTKFKDSQEITSNVDNIKILLQTLDAAIADISSIQLLLNWHKHSKSLLI
jgi:hypothetical protein